MIRARTALLLMMLFSAATSCRPAEPRPTTHNPRPIIFIGLDGGDWHYLDRLMAAGVMPNLSALVRAGAHGPLTTQQPPLSPLVWTTMMTGASPLQHRILDFTRYNPATHALEPITSDERAVPAIWNMAASHGKKVAVFGMWATYPPEPGIILSDRDASLHAGGGRGTPIERVAAATETIHRAATETITREHPDLAIIYFEGTDAIGHLLAGRDGPEPRRYFARIDQILGDYRTLADRSHATLLLASDHGFDWDGNQPAESSTNSVTAARWHRERGIFLAVPKIDKLPQSVADITPLLLAQLGLPTNLRQYRKPPPTPQPSGSANSQAQLEQLRALGYLDAQTPASSQGTRTAGSFSNEALILRNLGRDDEAVSALEGALRVDPHNAAALWNLSDLLRHLGRSLPRADALLDAAIAADPHQPRWLLTRARHALERHDCRAARADFARAATLLPREAVVYTGLGTAEACLGNEAAARAAFAKSLALDPNQPPLRQ
jgi:tetratricopeptide (TPR) repeat protein